MSVIVTAALAASLAACGEDPSAALNPSGSVSAQQMERLLPIIEDTFLDVYGPFRPENDLSMAGKQEAFADKRGRYVKWRAPLGTVQRIRGNRIRAEFLHVKRGHIVEAKTIVDFAEGEGEKLLSTQPGQLVDYRARLNSFRTGNREVTIFLLDDGVVLDVIRPD